MGKSLKGKELGVGISQRKDGLYQGSFTDCYGKRRFVYGKTLKEVTKKLNDKKHEDTIGTSIKPNDYTLEEWFEYWVKNYKANVRDSTTMCYYKRFTHIRESLGKMRLDKLNSIQFQTELNHIESTSVRELLYKDLKNMFHRAVKAHILKENPLEDVVIEHYDPGIEKRVLSDYEVDLIKEYATGTFLDFINIQLNTGMRGGEILGLTWDYVDFENNTIKVRQTYIYFTDKEGHLVTELHKPKTRRGNRDIPMTEEVKEIFLRLHKQRKEKSDDPLDNIILRSKRGNPISVNYTSKWFHALVKKINKNNPDVGFEEFTSHALRRTFATNAIKNGMNPKTLEYILGHSSFDMTMDLYCRNRSEDVREQMQKIGKLA